MEIKEIYIMLKEIREKKDFKKLDKLIEEIEKYELAIGDFISY